jgi:UrcA family protein
MFRTLQSVVVAIVASTVFIPSGHAETGMKQTSVHVSYADLNLSTSAGARTLATRLKSATRRVCGSRPAPLMLAAISRYETCLDNAMSAAVAQIDSPVVTAHLTGQTSVTTASR